MKRLLLVITLLVAVFAVGIGSIFLCVAAFGRELGEKVGGGVSAVWMIFCMVALIGWDGRSLSSLLVHIKAVANDLRRFSRLARRLTGRPKPPDPQHISITQLELDLPTTGNPPAHNHRRD